MKANSLVFENQLTQKIVDFIQSIGIEVRKETISEKMDKRIKIRKKYESYFNK